MANPIIPTSTSNPVMTGQITRKAVGRISKAVPVIKRQIMAVYDAIPRRRIDADTGIVINSTLPDDHWLHVNQNIVYEYQLSAELLTQISNEIELILRRAYMGTELPTPLSNWYMYSAVDQAYEQGTGLAVTNLNVISDEYTRSLVDVVTSPPYINRVALVRARVFEEMEGLTASVKSDIAGTLARGMEAGEGPRAIAKRISERTGVSKSRAVRIARTEINTAHRRARRAEAKDAQDRLGIRTGLLHISALSPTTRTTHARRNGRVYSIQDTEEWYNKDGNAINCKCSQSEVLLDEDGNPTSTKLIERLKAKGDKFFSLKDN